MRQTRAVRCSAEIIMPAGQLTQCQREPHADAWHWEEDRKGILLQWYGSTARQYWAAPEGYERGWNDAMRLLGRSDPAPLYERGPAYMGHP